MPGRPFLLALLLAAAPAVGRPMDRGTPAIIWDDDCGSDVDCVYSLNAIHRWIGAGRVHVLAFILDSPNPYGAPVMKAWEEHYRHPTPIGAWRGATGAAGADSGWSRAVRDMHDAGDTSDLYPDCVAVYRTALARAADASVTIVETGFPTCLAAVMRSTADAASPLSGAALLRARVRALYVMGGDYPGPATEYNFRSAPAESAYLLANWTSRNGFAPIYLNGYAPGSRIVTGNPPGLARLHPAMTAEAAAGTTSRPSWDLLSLYQAVFGTRDFRVGPSGTNFVNPATGENRWSGGTSSGHHVVTLRHPPAYYRLRLNPAPGHRRARPSNAAKSSAVI